MVVAIDLFGGDRTHANAQVFYPSLNSLEYGLLVDRGELVLLIEGDVCAVSRLEQRL